MMKKTAIALFAVLATATAAQAQERNVRGIVGLGLTLGGDTLATVTYFDGTTDSIKAGGMVHLYGGAEFRISPQLTMQATVGYHVDNTNGNSNGTLRFSRYPVELLAHYQINDKVRLGGGARLVNSAKLGSSGVLSGLDVSFNSTVGVVLEGEYMIAPQLGLKLRGVSEKYEPNGGGSSVDGNHIGFYGSWYF